MGRREIKEPQSAETKVVLERKVIKEITVDHREFLDLRVQPECKEVKEPLSLVRRAVKEVKDTKVLPAPKVRKVFLVVKEFKVQGRKERREAKVRKEMWVIKVAKVQARKAHKVIPVVKEVKVPKAIRVVLAQVYKGRRVCKAVRELREQVYSTTSLMYFLLG